jgi:hypothetical protein
MQRSRMVRESGVAWSADCGAFERQNSSRGLCFVHCSLNNWLALIRADTTRQHLSLVALWHRTNNWMDGENKRLDGSTKRHAQMSWSAWAAFSATSPEAGGMSKPNARSRRLNELRRLNFLSRLGWWMLHPNGTNPNGTLPYGFSSN